jgi:hypothetical protein
VALILAAVLIVALAGPQRLGGAGAPARVFQSPLR